MSSKNTNIDKDTCWYDTTTCPEQMILGARGVLWPVLKQSDHFPVLKDLIKTTQNSAVTILDLGCGAAELSDVFVEYFYVGADLENIIEDVAMKLHPDKNYISFDIYAGADACSFIGDYDIVVMNAFIDILQYPIIGLENVLINAQKYVIIHRQRFDDENSTDVIKNPSYGGSTYQSIINSNEFQTIIRKHKFRIVKELNVYNDSKSLLLEKEK